jgi:hypothetical protein
MKGRISNSAALLVVLFTTAIAAQAQVTLFVDNFEGGNLNQWVGQFGGPHHGLIVPDPLNPANNVLTFTAVNAGGDIFHEVPGPVDLTVQHLVLSFDFLALPIGGVVPSEYGGFAGVNTVTFGPEPFWLAGTDLPEVNPIGVLLATDGLWHHYRIDFTSLAVANNLTSFFVLLEDWNGKGSIAGDVYFDNVKVTSFDPNVLAQLVPCAGPSTGGKWKNHGAYVSAMAKLTDTLLAGDFITQEEKDAYVSAAATSNCGK